MGTRSKEAHLPKTNEKIGLPYRPFLYTIDQISGLLNIKEANLIANHIYFEGRSIGSCSRDLLLARNIAPRTEKPDWRIVERELLRWMKRKGFRHYEPLVADN